MDGLERMSGRVSRRRDPGGHRTQPNLDHYSAWFGSRPLRQPTNDLLPGGDRLKGAYGVATRALRAP